MAKPIVNINNWGVVALSMDPYLAPELIQFGLHGNITNHPEFPDGKLVTTSIIRGRLGDNVVTYNTIYILGDPAEEYEKMFPDAKARLLHSLEEVTIDEED